ncbi:WD repeat-containing protein 96 [Trypanosoma conorhini]|uniref:Cilia- and flagella-associated protein 43 n=1 Tax=Trypanosoma conorhini TaxID=83891 RepID=A0A422QBL4_9TRYP|nr:WD repeat-containing protein 96 [Trypanosoma conorhini]RNF27361.1 WD repeat-containing protein 96 [Trypanosoma conorhini]
MSSNAFILGFNSPAAVCPVSNSLLVGAGGGVVVRRGGESNQWVPADGRYPVDHLAYSPLSHLLCVTEKRLNVVLHVFRFPELSRVQKVDDFARVEVQDMQFSPNGQMLAVLNCVPNCYVTLFMVQRGRTLEKCVSVTLADKFWKYLVFPPQRTDCVAVWDAEEVALISHLVSDSASPNVVSLASNDREFYSCCWSTYGVLCGLKQGSILLFDELQMEMRDYLTCPDSGAVTSMLHTTNLLLAGTENGAIFGYKMDEKAVNLLIQVEHVVERLLLSESGEDAVIVTRAEIAKLNLDKAESAVTSRRDTGNTVKLLNVGDYIVRVSTEGSLMRYDKTTNDVLYFTTEFGDKAGDACAVGSAVIVAYHSGYMRCFLVGDEFTFSSQIALGEMPLTVCESDGLSSLAVSDGAAVYFATLHDGVLQARASVDTFTATVKTIRWNLGGHPSVLAACTNGEIHLLQGLGAAEASLDSVAVETVWRLDYPAHDFLPLYLDDDVVNVLVHSLDKDTKLYVLERRRERDIKSLRPLFLMRDHEGSGGSVLQRFGDTAVVSGGADGKVIVRDISHYLSRLTPIPPSKEKRRPRGEFPIRHLGKGGITSLCAWNDNLGFVCGGNDEVVHFIPSSKSMHYSWTEPVWRKEKLPGPSDTTQTSEEAFNAMGELNQSSVQSRLAEIRGQVQELLKERTSAVQVEDFLLPQQRESFRAECDWAIHKAKEEDYYHLLHNEFTQYTIRRDCWDTMEVQRSKIVSLNDLALEVHNFHRRKADPEEAKLLKKLKFLRLLQKKDGDYFTFSPLLKQPGTDPAPLQHAGDIADDTSELLYDAMDVYTNSRAVMQIYLLRGRASKLKLTFNARFDSLFERKKRELQRIAERNDRCRRILLQLGETSVPEDFFFTPVFDVEEDPKTVFDVFDSEIDPELLKLAKKDDNDAFVISPTDEAALKTWMDGLEKDTEVLAVKVALPAFADETLEQYVDPEDRTEEQQRAYEEYEKQLAEQTAYVNERKEALRAEMEELRKNNREAAKVVDDEIASLRRQRMEVAELVDELESHQMNALRRLFLPITILNELLRVMKEKAELQERVKQLESLELYRENLLATEESRLQHSIEEEEGVAVRMRDSPPFDDSTWGDKLYRRLTRWRTRYEEGQAQVPLVGQNDTIPLPLWKLFCECCSAIVVAKSAVARNTATVQTFAEALKEVEVELTRVRGELQEKEAEEESCKQGAVRKLLNVQNLYRLRQGQVQDEEAVLNADFTDFSFRRAKDVLDHNALIFASFDEISRLMGNISRQRQSMKMAAWETERLLYCVGTLEMELRQLHTLRVTRQMQEIIHTGALVSREEEVEKLNRRVEYVRQVMSKRVEERNKVITRLHMQINDRQLENTLLGDQVQRIKSVVDDKKAVWDMLGEHNNDSTRLQERMRELYENSELEELARCQQEELVRLKREVDRLRERTFPSFAVVSKKTVS